MATATALRFALAATHRVINRVHHHAAHMGAAPLPARSTRFAARDVHVIDIANLSERRISAPMNSANLAGRQFDQCITTFPVVQRRLLPGAARNLSSPAREQY